MQRFLAPFIAVGLVIATVAGLAASQLWFATNHPTPQHELVAMALDDPEVRADAADHVAAAVADRLGPLGEIDAVEAVIAAAADDERAAPLVQALVEQRVAQLLGREPRPVVIEPTDLIPASDPVLRIAAEVLPQVSIAPEPVAPLPLIDRVPELLIATLTVVVAATLAAWKVHGRALTLRLIAAALGGSAIASLAAKAVLLSGEPSLGDRLVAATLHVPLSVGALVAALFLILTARPKPAAPTRQLVYRAAMA